MRVVVAGLLAAAAGLGAHPSSADVVARGNPAAGSVIARKSGEEVRFIDVASWRSVDVKQDLLAGDVLRTNALGSLAILFSDRTQMRLGRNTTLLVKAVGAAADSRFGLQSGTMWGRAERGGIGLTVDTPAAAAAIRGTDWSLTVDGEGRTSLIVLEGLVELSNEFGSVSVAEGEAAVARIGQAPTKIVIVDPDDREQMLFHLALRNAFNALPVSPLSSAEMRAERARIAARPEAARSAEDRVSLAEVSLSYDGRAAARAAIAAARGKPLSASQRARLDLAEAMLAAAEGRYAEADALFRRAAPRLSGSRRAMAAYGGYYARALANPNRAEQPPRISDGGPYAALAEAWTAGFLADIRTAAEILRRAEARYPDDPTLPAVRAQFALLLDDRPQVEEAIARALALDPDDPTALEARANYRAGMKGEIEGAYRDLARAAEIAPGSTTIWNALGIVQSARGASREAEAAFLRSIELDPQDPLGHANYAIFLLDHDRVAEAGAEIDKAIALDPSFDIALVARGRYHLQKGEIDKGRDDLLAGSTANPAYAQALLLLAGAYYEGGEGEPAAQAIENADRLDPNDPVTSSFRTAIAIDDYDADAAITQAQQALKRTRARGGDYAALSASREAGSTLNDAYRLAGLDAWGRYYGAATFDPFTGAGYVDQTLSGSADPFVNRIDLGGSPVEPGVNVTGFSTFIQGLMIDPAMISGRSRSANLFRRPFVEGSLGGGFIAKGGDVGWTGEAEIQGYSAAPYPWSFYGKLDARMSEEFREGFTPGVPFPTTSFTLADDDIAGTGYVTARPTPVDRVVAYVDIRRERDTIDDLIFIPPAPIVLPTVPPISIVGVGYDRSLDSRSGRGGLVWSHTFGHRNVGNVAIFGSGLDQASDETGLFVFDLGGGATGVAGRDIDTDVSQRAYLASASHIYGAGEVTLRYGAEGGRLEQRHAVVDTITIGPIPAVTTTVTEIDVPVARGHFDFLWEPTPALQFEAGIFPVHLGGVLDTTRLDPRVGAGWTPVDGHWLRAGFLSETTALADTTLAPVGVLGLQANQIPMLPGGRTDTFAARWEAEWTDRLFTALDFQHQEVKGLSIAIPGGISTIDLAEGRVDRLAATANLWLGGGFGASASFAWADSENRDPASAGFGGPLPFVPETAARLALTWVHPANLKVTLAATYVGERESDIGTRLGDYWTADAFLTWEPFDKRFALELAGYNLLDEGFDVASSVPGWGRTFTGSLKVRF